jgi:hypothetical protein
MAIKIALLLTRTSDVSWWGSLTNTKFIPSFTYISQLVSIIINSMEQNPSSEADSQLARQEIRYFVWKLKVNVCDSKCGYMGC